MEKKITNTIKYFLVSHILLVIILLLYVSFVAITRKYFYMFDERMPWQETCLNVPLKYLLSINLVLYWTKLFAFSFFILLLSNHFNLNRKILFLMIIVLIIYLIIKFNILHNLIDLILSGYDVNAPTLDASNYKYF